MCISHKVPPIWVSAYPQLSKKEPLISGPFAFIFIILTSAVFDGLFYFLTLFLLKRFCFYDFDPTLNLREINYALCPFFILPSIFISMVLADSMSVISRSFNFLLDSLLNIKMLQPLVMWRS